MRDVDVCNRHDIESLLSSIEFHGSGASRYGLCPLPNHTHSSGTPSFSIFPGKDKQKWRCHGQCNTGGDVIDLAGFMWVAGYDPKSRESRKLAIEELEGSHSVSAPVVLAKPIKPLPQWFLGSKPSDRVIEFALSRGIAKNQIDEYKIGSVTKDMNDYLLTQGLKGIAEPHIWMTIPTIQGGTLIGIQMRNITKNGIRYLTFPGSRGGVWNHDAVSTHKGKSILTKGAIAGIVISRFTQWPYVCSVSNGESQIVNEALFLAKKVLYIGDHDKAGLMSAKSKAATLHTDTYIPPEPHDIDKWLITEPEVVLPSIMEWLNE